MNFTLNILDKDGAPLDVTDLELALIPISVTDAADDSIIVDLKAGNTYTLKFIDGGASNITGSSSIEVSFLEEPSLVTTVTENIQNGLDVITITPTVDITQIDFSHGGDAADTFIGDIRICGEDITVTIDGNVTNGANIAVETIADNDTIDISVVSAGFHPYTNTVRVYDYDVDVSIKMIPIVTDVNDPEFRRPYPFFFEILEPCSYNIHTYNAQSAPFGMISYYHTEDVDNTFATTPNGVLDTCAPESMSITQRIVVRAIANCGGSSPVIFDEIYTINPITTTEYKPYVVLARPLDCCENLSEEIAIDPQEIQLYNVGIHEGDITTINPVLTYTMVDPEGTETVLASYSGTEVDAGPLTSLGFTYTPTMLGTYTLITSVTNMCTTTTTEEVFDVCNSWKVTNTDCNIIEITNLSQIDPLVYTIKELNDVESFDIIDIDNISQNNIEVAPGTSVALDMQIDNVYTLRIARTGGAVAYEREFVFVLDCNIKKCKKELLRNFLCGEDECDELTRIANKEKLLEFNVLELILRQKWDVWKQEQSIVNTFSINDIMEDIITLTKVIESLNKLCAKCGITDACSADKRSSCVGNYPCGNPELLKDNDCGCN